MPYLPNNCFANQSLKKVFQQLVTNKLKCSVSFFGRVLHEKKTHWNIDRNFLATWYKSLSQTSGTFIKISQYEFNAKLVFMFH